jgi:guanyl-specific ribonuclease Sa
MKRRSRSLWISLLLAVILTIGSLAGCRSGGPAGSAKPQENASVLQTVTDDAEQENQEGLQQIEAEPEEETPAIDEDGSYTTKEDVALYIHTYGKLPSNFITKKEAEKLGWDGGSLEPYAPGKCIGGNYFGNYEGLLPDGNYKECDIDTLGKKKRGARRIIYSDDGRIYYTDDHYESFTQLY